MSDIENTRNYPEQAASLEGKSEKLTARVITSSWDQNMNIWIRNTTGTSFDLREIIRELADRAAIEGSDLEVLEVIDGIPLKSLDVGGESFRRYGDALISGDSGHHSQPNINTTVVSGIDWTRLLFEEDSAELEEDIDDVCRHFIFPSLDKLKKTSGDFSQVKKDFLKVYEDKVAKGEIQTSEGQDSLKYLDGLHEDGKYFDLVFLDHESCTDKIAYIQAVQRILSVGGYAYLPISWWVPGDFDGGSSTTSVLWNERIETNSGSEDLVTYLVREFPESFEVAHSTGTEILIIKGTPEPILLPSLEEQSEEYNYYLGFSDIDTILHELDPENKLELFGSTPDFALIHLALSAHSQSRKELKKIIKRLLNDSSLKLSSVLEEY